MVGHLERGRTSGFLGKGLKKDQEGESHHDGKGVEAKSERCQRDYIAIM